MFDNSDSSPVSQKTGIDDLQPSGRDPSRISTIPLGCPTGVLAGVLDRRTTDVVLGRCHQRVPSFWLSQRIGGFCRSLATLRPAKAVTIGIAGTTGLFP